ncbi:MAG: hypothetical protein LKH76_09980 [Acetobacter fabarum]|jgi:hypothetical protein|uniref:Uncharacterized protein n=1 Tax=Acetobacter fabarum TaxID=483199 RepID=A0A269Y0V6_9PROT|nr:MULTISPECIES: hypothetical protein [Acetobacter]MCH4025920.1 hypothetical protein [Acetobacter fabarum]MCH4055991.1 hypothetical protein [Acetobacter fabarum]MCH4086220.1 hypothetical protein [Acetobacter fabarum]MCH4128862.1 hypothetical protein [Acetobacter fabarum]MCH4138094.1 hypothetical protein [Acetobacter fabarum]
MPARLTPRRFTRPLHLVPRLTLATLLALSGCGYYSSRIAHKGQLAVLGMTNEDLQACVGVPDRTQIINEHVRIYQYTRGTNIPATNDSTLIPLQTLVNLTQTTLGGAGSTCVASIRLVDGRVTDMHYSGDNDQMIGSDGVCATVIKGCLNTPVPSAHKVSGTIFGPVSAFHAPDISGFSQSPHNAAPAAPQEQAAPASGPTPPAPPARP